MPSEKNKKVAIIGAGLTGLVTAYYLKKKGTDCIILEKNSAPGGVIQTRSEDGFIYEKGPNTGVLSNIETIDLFDDLSDKCKLEIANESAKKRLIWKNKQWHPLPSGMREAVTTPLFTIYDKFRILGEPFRKRGTNPDETLSDMVRRRLGKSFLDYAVNPFILGIYAGDPDYLIPKYALPKLYRLEQTYGSFIGGSMKKKKAERHNNLAQRVTRDVFSVKGGLENLVHALVDSIGEENILTGIDNLSADRVKSGYLLSGSHDKADDVLISADHVVSTTGPYEYKTLFPFLEADELAVLNNLLYARVVQVTVGFEQWNGAAIDAFGGLVPSKENRNVLGILFPSSCFNGRAPKGGALFSVFAGGIKHPEIVDLTDNELVKLVSEEFCSMMKIHAFNPDFIKIHRYSHAIPQYGISSRERLEMIQNVQHKYPGLHLGGNIQEGIGMADRIKQGTDISNHILSFNQML